MFRGGGETYTLNIAKGLKELGCEIRFIVSKPWSGKVKYPIEDFDTEYIPSPYLRDLAQWMSAGNPYFEKIPVKPLRNFSQKGYRFIAGRISKFDNLKSQNDIFDYLKKRDKDYDIVQVFGHSVLASRIVEELGIPTVIFLPGPPSMTYEKEIKKCSAVITDGFAIHRLREMREDAIRIPNGIDASKFKPTKNNVRAIYEIKADEKLLIFVGRFVPLKNLPFLIKEIKEVVKLDSKIKLMLVGEGPLYNQIVDLVSRLNLQNHVVFTGRIPHDDLAKYYSAADVFVLTSSYDNSPNALLEAMACGLPIIATRVGGIPMLVEYGINGVLIENNNIGEFKEAVLKLVNNSGLCKKMGERNRTMVTKKYSWSKSAEKFLEIYERILTNR